MIFNETWCTQPSLGKGEVVSSILTGSTTAKPLDLEVLQGLLAWAKCRCGRNNAAPRK